MSSHDKESFSDIIEKLSEWSQHEVEENLGHALPVLLSVLQRSDQKTSSLQAVQVLLSRCLPCIPVNTVEEQLFQHVLPTTKQLFNEALEGIFIMLQETPNPEDNEVLESLNSLLKVCIELLKCIDCTLSYVLTIGKVQATLVPSLPKVTVSILYEAFKHCKESEKLYGIFFQTLGEVLTTLFQTSHELQLRLLEVVSENLQFKCIYEDELILLIEILEMLGQIGQLVMGLDLKTMVELWKGYARLAFQYADHLKPRLDVTGPLQFLAINVSQNIERIIELEPLDVKSVTRTVKVGSFTLKIIIKFCDQYNGYLGTCFQELFLMLLTMYRYSRPYLQMKNVPSDIVQNIQAHLTIGAEPLLTHLVAEVEFIEKVRSYGNTLAEPQSHRLAFYLLSISILKKLLHCSNDVRTLWLNCDPANNLLFVLFRGLDHCHAEMSMDLQIPGVMHSGEPERLTDLYESIMTHIAGLVLSASVQEFSLIEEVLLESILQPTIWRALLAMDIWCIISRSGSSDLCFHHVCHLIEVVKQLTRHHGRPEKTYLLVLIGRLFSLLSNKHKMQIVEMFPPNNDPFVWQALSVKVLPDRLRTTVIESLIKSANSHTEKFLTLPASVDMYNSMMDALAAATQCVEVQSSCQGDIILITNNVIMLWEHISFNKFLSTEDTSVKGSHWMTNFVSILCSISSSLVLQMNNMQLIKMLERLKYIISHGSSSLKLKIIIILKKLANKFIDSTPEQMKVFQHVAGLFRTLLQDKNHLVQQMTFEVFTYFAHVNSHESILALSVKNNVFLQHETRRYLQKLPVKVPDKNFVDYESYVKYQSEVHFSHRCSTGVHIQDCKAIKLSPVLDTDTLKENINDNRPSKKPKLDIITVDSIIKAIERLKRDTHMIVQYCESNNLLPEANQDILQIAMQLKDLSSIK